MSDGSQTLAHREAVLDADLRKALARLAWPAVLATGAQATFAIVDAIYVGRWLGRESLAAVATSAFVLWSLGALTNSVSVGVAALLVPGALVEVDTLLRLSSGQGWALDNFEGLAVLPGGRILIVSDDNTRAVQATLLAAFELAPTQRHP